MRLIDADELKEYIDAFIRVDKHYHPKGKHELIPISEVYDRIEQTPTADVVERKKGEWIDRGDYCVCNQCGHTEQQFNGVEPIPLHTPFCAICGADMRGEEKRENAKKD